MFTTEINTVEELCELVENAAVMITGKKSRLGACTESCIRRAVIYLIELILKPHPGWIIIIKPSYAYILVVFEVSKKCSLVFWDLCSVKIKKKTYLRLILYEDA